MATSQIDVYLSLVSSVGGLRRQIGTTREPFLTITGTADPAISSDDVFSVGAGASVTVYNYSTHGAFECALVSADQDIEVWTQFGTPADGASAKGSLVWQCQVVPADRPFLIPTDQGRTNSTTTNHNADNSDAPLGASDSGETDARAWLIVIKNTGSDTASVNFSRRS